MFGCALRGGFKGWKFSGPYLSPQVLGYVILGMIFNLFLRLNGPLNTLLEMVGLKSWALDWINRPVLALLSLGTVYSVFYASGSGQFIFSGYGRR